MDRPTAVIRLELHLGEDSLTGRASDGRGAAREFTGWVGLMAAIDALATKTSTRRRPMERNHMEVPTPRCGPMDVHE